MGNICRSPIAEGIIRHRFEEAGIPVIVDSAGTISYHTGEAPDHRAQKEALKNGIDISMLKARQILKNDFTFFDLILVMDNENMRDVLSLTKLENEKSKVKLIMNYAYPNQNKIVPDPYYGEQDGFSSVFNMIDLSITKLIETLK